MHIKKVEPFFPRTIVYKSKASTQNILIKQMLSVIVGPPSSEIHSGPTALPASFVPPADVADLRCVTQQFTARERTFYTHRDSRDTRIHTHTHTPLPQSTQTHILTNIQSTIYQQSHHSVLSLCSGCCEATAERWQKWFFWSRILQYSSLEIFVCCTSSERNQRDLLKNVLIIRGP